jgi:hypothetical protein
VIIWELDLQLPMQSVPITTTVVSLNPIHGEVYSIQHKLISDKVCQWLATDRSVVFSRYRKPIKLKYYWKHNKPTPIYLLTVNSFSNCLCLQSSLWAQYTHYITKYGIIGYGPICANIKNVSLKLYTYKFYWHPCCLLIKFGLDNVPVHRTC